ncbi:MAG TPA: hypothetical protein VGS23_05495, partial [Thermoplasmata archaeon]|nr:hypothetical protein [Thermoplasmata archaeon]
MDDARFPVLTGTTIRRTLSLGRLYLAIGVAVSLILALTLILGARSRGAFATTFPLEIPIFAVLGSTGGLLTFTSD